MSFWKKSATGIPTQKTSREWFILILIGVIGAGASFLAHGVVLERENVLIQSNFSRASERILSFLKYNLAFESNLFCSFQHLDEHSENIRRREFRDFISGMLQQNTGLQALGWVPKVSDVELTTQIIDRRDPFHNFVNPYVRKDGRIAILETSGFPIVDESGALIGYRGIDRDVTERMEAEKARRLLTMAIEQAAEPTLITDVHGTIEYVNPAFEKVTGYSRDEVIGKNPDLLKSGQHDDAFYRNMLDTISNGGTWSGVVTNKRKDNSLIYLEMSISPLRDASGRIVNYVSVNRDITAERTLKTQLAQSQKMEAIGTLASGIAHDFNNIIYAITGYAEMALARVDGDDHLVSYLEKILHSADRAGHMTKQILSFSRKSEPENRLLNIRPIIKEGLKFLRGPIPANIEIEQHIETDIPTINGDPTQIYQILINLCANASHAMGPDPGILSVSLSSVELDREFCEKHAACEPGVFVKLTVRDSGAGIAPEIADRIFEPYFTTKASGEGTGLGLSVLKGIVHSHDGIITVDSEPEKGASFSIYFPAVEEKVHIQVEPEPESGFADHKKILWVDDEHDLMPMYKATFEAKGFEVFGVTHPNAALELFDKSPDKFDLVITDLTMPNMNGIQLAKTINSIRPGLPIIICTGYTNFAYSTALSDIGVREVIHKPVLRDTMTKAIMRTIQKSGNHEQVENQPAESEFALQALANSFSGFVSPTAPVVRKS